ncbi:hypothetical protein Tco_0184961 [Tanacetum coccineum]
MLCYKVFHAHRNAKLLDKSCLIIVIYAISAMLIVPAVYLQQFWKTVRKVPDTEDTIIFKLDNQEIIYTVDMFHNTLQLLVETPENPFVAPVNIEIIESFMHTVGYQGVVDKLFHVVVKHTNVDYDDFLLDFMNCVSQKKDVSQYPCFTKLIIADLMKKFPSIPLRLEEDYHSIKDDIPLVSVYTTGNVQIRGMLIPDAFLTAEIRATNDYKEYETVFELYSTPTLTTASPQGKKRKQSAGKTSSPLKSLKVTIKQKQVVKGEKDVESYADKFVASMINDVVDDFGDRIESGSRKEHPKVVVDDDDNKEGKGYLYKIVPQLAERATNDLIDGNLKRVVADTIIQERDTFQAEVHALIFKEFDAQAPHIIEELLENYVQNNVIQVLPTTTALTETTSSADLQQQLYLKMKSNPQES